MQLSIIVPVHNEAERINTCVYKLCSWLVHQPYTAEIILVENGSTDDTLARANWWAVNRQVNPVVRTLHVHARSKALAVQTGMIHARGDILMMVDCDLSTPPQEYDKLIRAVLLGADVAIASRRLEKSQVKQSLKRRAIGWVFSVLTGFLLPGIRDTQCGFKAFKRTPGRTLFTWMVTTSMAFDVELLLNARRMGYRIVEVPVVWKENKDSRVRLLTDSLLMARDVWRMNGWKEKNGPQLLQTVPPKG